jgi:hypothetical protein
MCIPANARRATLSGHGRDFPEQIPSHPIGPILCGWEALSDALATVSWFDWIDVQFFGPAASAHCAGRIMLFPRDLFVARVEQIIGEVIWPHGLLRSPSRRMTPPAIIAHCALPLRSSDFACAFALSSGDAFCSIHFSISSTLMFGDEGSIFSFG